MEGSFTVNSIDSQRIPLALVYQQCALEIQTSYTTLKNAGLRTNGEVGPLIEMGTRFIRSDVKVGPPIEMETRASRWI